MGRVTIVPDRLDGLGRQLEQTVAELDRSRQRVLTATAGVRLNTDDPAIRSAGIGSRVQRHTSEIVSLGHRFNSRRDLVRLTIRQGIEADQGLFRPTPLRPLQPLWRPTAGTPIPRFPVLRFPTLPHPFPRPLPLPRLPIITPWPVGPWERLTQLTSQLKQFNPVRPVGIIGTHLINQTRGLLGQAIDWTTTATQTLHHTAKNLATKARNGITTATHALTNTFNWARNKLTHLITQTWNQIWDTITPTLTNTLKTISKILDRIVLGGISEGRSWVFGSRNDGKLIDPYTTGLVAGASAVGGYSYQVDGNGLRAGANFDGRSGIQGQIGGRTSIGGVDLAGEAGAFLGTRGSGSADVEISGDRLRLNAEGEVFSGVEVTADGTISGYGLKGEGSASAMSGGVLSGKANVDFDGRNLRQSVGGEAFIGAKAEAEADVSLLGDDVQVGGSVGVATGLGGGFSGEGAFGLDEVGVDLDISAVLGVGFDVGIDVSFSPSGLAKDAGNVVGGGMEKVRSLKKLVPWN